MTMNETVDSVYRFVTDQSSSAYSKMNSFVASLRRRLDKVLTVASNAPSPSNTPDANHGEAAAGVLEELIVDARSLLLMTDKDHDALKKSLHAAEMIQQQPEACSPTTKRRLIEELRSSVFLSHSDDYYLSSTKAAQQSNKSEKSHNVYDTLSKHRPIARSNPTVDQSNKNEAGKTARMQRHSLRSSMRHFIKRRSMKGPSKTILGSPSDRQSTHIYESLDTPPLDSPLGDQLPPTPSDANYSPPPLPPPVFKSSYILPSSLVVLDHFTTNLYLVVNTTLNQLLVVFGSTKIHTIKLYDTNGRKILPNDLLLQYKFEDLHGYKLLSSGLNHSLQNRIIVNEIRVYVTQPADELHNPAMGATITTASNQTLKQRLLFFDQQGHYISASKRLPVTNELSFVEVDRSTASIYAYDGLNLINIDQNWSTSVENMDCIAAGANFLVCLHGKTNQISIYNNQTGFFIYRWLITSANIRHLQATALCVSRQDVIYVLVWNCDVHPVNNLVLVFDQEGQLHREYYVPNRILPNLHGTYTYDVTLGTNTHHSGNPLSNLIRRPSRKPDAQTLAWMQQQQQQQQQALWSPNGRHPQLWPNAAPPSQLQQMYRGLGRAYDAMYQQQQQQQQQQQDDHTLFHPRFIAVTDDDTLILSNIIDLGLDEETQETAVVNVSRKILFFHLDP